MSETKSRRRSPASWPALQNGKIVLKKIPSAKVSFYRGLICLRLLRVAYQTCRDHLIPKKLITTTHRVCSTAATLTGVRATNFRKTLTNCALLPLRFSRSVIRIPSVLANDSCLWLGVTNSIEHPVSSFLLTSSRRDFLLSKGNRGGISSQTLLTCNGLQRTTSYSGSCFSFLTFFGEPRSLTTRTNLQEHFGEIDSFSRAGTLCQVV